MTASVHEALAVLDRATGWLARDGNLARARYVEATLGRWLPSVAEDGPAQALAGLREELSGIDEVALETRAERLGRLRSRLDALIAEAGSLTLPEPAPRAVLLPEGVSADLPPKIVPPPPIETTVIRLDGSAPEEALEARREERPREERAREDRPREERNREGREDRPREERSREGREDRPREERGERRDRRDRDRDRDRGEKREKEEPEARVEPAPEPVKVEEPKPPPPPPEPKTFPLGHPEGTGEPVEALGVFSAAELAVLAAQEVVVGADLLLRAPVAVERAGERWIPGVTPEGAVIVRGTVKARYTRFSPGFRRYEILLGHDKGDVACRWVGPVPAEVAALAAGAEVGFAGRLELDEERPVLFEGEPLGIDGRGGDWFPRYGIEGMDESRMRAGMRAALRRYAGTLQDHLPAELIERNKLIGLAQALRDVHFPSNATRKGRQRLGFDELLQVQLGVALLKNRDRRERGLANPIGHALVAQAHAMAGWSFTDAQEAAFDDIRRDLKRSQPMARLLQGDVGVGKHAVVQAAMLTVAEAKHQALFLAPDALAAEHRYLFAEAFFRSIGLEPMLLLGPPTRAQAEQLKKGEALIIYGTHALTRDVPAFRRLGLVVFEEQGTYGAADVAPFEVQGVRPDMLVFTPTPVPSAIALNLYGQLAMTLISDGHGRGVDSFSFSDSNREEAYTIARQALDAGEQVMIVFPVVRGQDLLSPSEARRLAEVLGTETFPKARVGIFNGGMSREERFRAYDDFQHRRTDLLLATTHVEHGPIVPNASVLIVEQAQQFDLVRLHRLRGHVGQGWRRGRCLLVTAEETRAESLHNVELLLKESDGFRIAELDLRYRGIEAALGDRAAEAPDFVWADPVQERDVLLKTRQEAVRLLLQDPGLKRRSNRALLNLVRARFGEDAVPDGAATPPPGAEPRGGGGGGRRRRRRGR